MWGGGGGKSEEIIEFYKEAMNGNQRKSEDMGY